ncbi:MAG: hypothetical protein WC985_07285 [Thermoplasmata archaeon]
MQPYLASKRPPRALFLTLAVALGLVALSAALLPSLVQGGLARDGTYLRLLGYEPASTGSSLQVQSVNDAQQGRGMLASARAPAATPAPPVVTAKTSPPTEAPADAATVPASAADRNPDLLGSPGPALQELNETRENLTLDPHNAFGLGVLPRDAGNVSGVPDLEQFVKPDLSEAGCTWTKEITSTDANHDGNPEYVRVRELGTCVFEKDETGKALSGATVARDIQAWDNDSSGVFNALEGRQGVEAYAAPINSTYEYTANAVWTLSLQDPDEDKQIESLRVTFAGEQRFDRNGNGNAEFVRTVTADIALVHDLNNETANSADVTLGVYQTYDLQDGGKHEYEGVLELGAHTVDTNRDGLNETATAAITAYETLDRDLDGWPELARGIDASFDRIDANSNGNAERASWRLYLYARADPTRDGILEVRKALEVTGLATDSNDDGNPELAQMTVHAASWRDLDQDGHPEMNATIDGTFEAYDDDSNGIYEKATLDLQAEATVDANSDGVPEEHAYATLDVLVLNEIQDQYPEKVEARFVASETLDVNADGTMDEMKGVTMDLLVVDANSNGHAETANLTIHATDVLDANHDGIPEYQASFDLVAHATDHDDDGHPEYVNVTAVGSALQDEDQNGVPEMTASLSYDARYADSDSNGVVENATVHFRAEKITYDANGTSVGHEWVLVDYHGEDLNQDGTMDNVYLLVEKHVITDA